MDARALGVRDLALLGRATGDAVMFASVVFRTILEHRDLDVQVFREGRDYMVVVTELLGDQVLADHRMPVVVDDLDEAVRLDILRIYVTGVLEGHARWRQRVNVRMAHLGIGPIPSALPAND
jgi:hypothetical protein